MTKKNGYLRPPESMNLDAALNRMRQGARLMKMSTVKAPNGTAFYVVPGGPVDPVDAAKIIERPDVHVFDDGLFPGIPQSWRMGGE
jgi:hypothetical protein